MQVFMASRSHSRSKALDGLLRQALGARFVCSRRRQRQRQRQLHTSSKQCNNRLDQSRYIDQWFASIVKNSSFYDAQSQSARESTTRCYFYNTDLQGRLFLEETLPKNIATSIKDARFLNFFYSRLRRTTPNDWRIMIERGIPLEEYPFVSPCARELNFVRPAASTPIVFHSLTTSSLVYAGSHTTEFLPTSLAISLASGRLYHRLAACDVEYGLIRSSVAVSLAEHMITHTDATTEFPNDDHTASPSSGLMFQSQEGLHCVPIPVIPDHVESGPWAMPI